MRPFERFTSKIFLLSMISRKLKPPLVWPMTLRMESLLMNGPNFDTTHDITSPASLDRCDAGNSLVQKSSTLWSFTYFSLDFM